MRFLTDLWLLLIANPRALAACLAGLLMSFGITQRIKFYLPAKWSAKSREVATQLLAFVLGTGATLALWDRTTAGAYDSIVAALIVGLLAPAVWNVAMLTLSWWRPELPKAFSQGDRQ